MIFQNFSVLLLAGALGELYLFFKVAEWIGFLPMVVLAVATSMLGVVMLRMQGMALQHQLSLALTRGQFPASALVEAGSAWISAVLLIIPGFFTDALGFLCLIPVVRRTLVRRFLPQQAAPPGPQSPPTSHKGPRTIEGDFTREEDKR
jgi:UPF0716 protein FxsA